VTGLDDEATLLTVRAIQGKLIAIANRATPPSSDGASGEDLGRR
jgi:hypothetical protein